MKHEACRCRVTISYVRQRILECCAVMSSLLAVAWMVRPVLLLSRIIMYFPTEREPANGDGLPSGWSMQHYVPKSYGDKTSDTHILFSSAPAQVPAETKYCFWRVQILKRRIGGICHEIIRNSADS
eukprot:scaffold11230_cov180-Skeletonema_marinoi.AAC.1